MGLNKNLKTSIALRNLHRWIGLIFSVSILMSAGSGVIHNVMSRTQAPPPPVRPGGGVRAEDINVAVLEALKKIEVPGTALQAVSVREIKEDPWYQFIFAGAEKPFYVNAKTGAVNDLQDEIYASQIASRYLGGMKVEKTDYLTRYNQEYINIFRILPVYRFDTADGKGTRLYVSTMTGSVTRATDDKKQFEANVFTNFHKFGFIPNKDVRDFVLTFLTAGIFLAAVLGIALFFYTK